MSTLIAFVLSILLFQHEQWGLASLLAIAVIAKVTLLLGSLLQVFSEPREEE